MMAALREVWPTERPGEAHEEYVIAPEHFVEICLLPPPQAKGPCSPLRLKA